MVEIRFTSHHFSPRYAYSFTDLAVKTSRPLKIGYLKTYSVCKSMKMKPIYHLCILSKSTNFEENNVHEDTYFVLQVLGNLPKEYDVQCQMMQIKLSAQKISIESMYKQLELRYDNLYGTKTARKNGCMKSTLS